MCLGGALSKGDCSLHLAAGIFIVHNSRYAAGPIIRDIILPRHESNRDNSTRFPDSAIDDTCCGVAEFPATLPFAVMHLYGKEFVKNLFSNGQTNVQLLSLLSKIVQKSRL